MIVHTGMQLRPKVHTPAKQNEKQNNQEIEHKPSKPTGTSNKKRKKQNNQEIDECCEFRLPLPPIDDDWATMVAAAGVCSDVE